jgi:hypothetical protein
MLARRKKVQQGWFEFIHSLPASTIFQSGVLLVREPQRPRDASCMRGPGGVRSKCPHLVLTVPHILGGTSTLLGRSAAGTNREHLQTNSTYVAYASLSWNCSCTRGALVSPLFRTIIETCGLCIMIPHLAGLAFDIPSPLMTHLILRGFWLGITGYPYFPGSLGPLSINAATTCQHGLAAAGRGRSTRGGSGVRTCWHFQALRQHPFSNRRDENY